MTNKNRPNKLENMFKKKKKIKHTSETRNIAVKETVFIV